MPQKMMRPLPDSGESERDRFQRFAKAILGVPKSEIETPEQTMARLQSEKRRIKQKIAAVKRAMTK